MRVGIYGGAFNPPHVGHLKVMVHAMAMGKLNRVHVAPAYKHPFGKDMVAFDDRCEMVARMVLPYPNIQMVQYERDFQTVYTIDLIERLMGQEKYLRAKPHTFVLIIGQDNLNVAHKWHRWDELTKLVEILVVPECGPERSTMVREAYATQDEDTIKRMVVPSVQAYIKENRLYTH